jgi:hypothetical protein
MGDKSQEKINVLPPPKTLFWTLFWGCDGCHRFLGVGGVGFGGIQLFPMETQKNETCQQALGFLVLTLLFSGFLAAGGTLLPYVAYAR